MAIVGKGGKMIVWYTRGGPLFFERTADTDVTVERPLSSGFWPLALDERSDRLTFVTGGTPRETAVSLRWASSDFLQGGLVTTLPQFGDGLEDDVQEMGWSPDGKVLVYESSGQIYLFDTAANSSKLLVGGHDPTWSPDGKWITYRSVGQLAARVTPDGRHLEWPGGRRKMIGALRWSPDGHYVLFSEDVPGLIPIVGTYHQLVVCRMRDGATVAVRNFVAGSRHAFLFHWILNYRSFCASCKTGKPSN